jgi:hypothetical protein
LLSRASSSLLARAPCPGRNDRRTFGLPVWLKVDELAQPDVALKQVTDTNDFRHFTRVLVAAEKLPISVGARYEKDGSRVREDVGTHEGCRLYLVLLAWQLVLLTTIRSVNTLTSVAAQMLQRGGV